MHLTIRSAFKPFAEMLAKIFTREPDRQVKVLDEDSQQTCLHYGTESDLVAVRSVLSPIRCLEKLDADLPRNHFILEIERTTLFALNVKVCSDSDCMRHQLKTIVEATGAKVYRSEKGVISKDQLECKSANNFAPQLLAWMLRGQGIEIQLTDGIERFSDYLTLSYGDPEEKKRPIKERMRLNVLCDDERFTPPLLKRLAAAGYKNVEVCCLSVEEMEQAAIGVFSPWFYEGGAQQEQTELVGIVSACVQDSGVDVSRYPVLTGEDKNHSLSVNIWLLLAECKLGFKEPYSLGG